LISNKKKGFHPFKPRSISLHWST